MRRPVLSSVLCLLAVVVLSAPSAWAAPTFKVEKVEVISTDGTALQYIPVGGLVKIRATLNNTGTQTVDETIGVRFDIVPESGGTPLNQTLRKAVKVESGNTTIVEYSWSPGGRVKGNHTLTVTVEGGIATPFTTSFIVTETAVPAGDYVDRLLTYYWFFGAFVLGAILFFVVLAARKS